MTIHGRSLIAVTAMGLTVTKAIPAVYISITHTLHPADATATHLLLLQ